jgi:hypothetical protein
MVAVMDARDRRSLKAVDEYLRDYCGEDAVRRWRATLSEAELLWLARPSDPMGDAWRLLVDALADLLRRVSALVARVLDALTEALTSAWVALTGSYPGWSGGDAR